MSPLRREAAFRVCLSVVTVPAMEEAEQRLSGGIFSRCAEQDFELALWLARHLAVDRRLRNAVREWLARLRLVVVPLGIDVCGLARACRRLEVLEARTNSSLDDTALAAVGTCDTLRVVDVRGCANISDTGVAALGDLVMVSMGYVRTRREPRVLTSRSLECWGPRLERLEVWDVVVEDESLATLATTSPRLSRLALGACDLRRVTQCRFANVKELNIQGALVNDDFFACLDCPRLDTVGGAPRDAVLASVKPHPSLRSLDLSGWLLEPRALGDLLRGSPFLDTLSLRGAKSRDVDADVSAVADCRHLVLLDLATFGLADDHVQQLVDACPGLYALDISGNQRLTDRALVALARAGHALRDLEVARCPAVTARGLLAFLIDRPDTCDVTRKLDLHGGLFFTDLVARLREQHRHKRKHKRNRQDHARRKLRRIQFPTAWGLAPRAFHDGYHRFNRTRGPRHLDVVDIAGPRTHLLTALDAYLRQGHVIAPTSWVVLDPASSVSPAISQDDDDDDDKLQHHGVSTDTPSPRDSSLLAYIV